MGVTDIDKLNKFGFQADEVSEILKNTVIDPQFKKTKAKKGGNRGKVDYKNILSSHENANDEQTFTHEQKLTRSAKCSGLNCKHVLQIGTPCVKVVGAIAAPYEKDFARLQQFFFCAKRQCITTPPVWSNIRRPERIIKGNNITLINEMQFQ